MRMTVAVAAACTLVACGEPHASKHGRAGSGSVQFVRHGAEFSARTPRYSVHATLRTLSVTPMLGVSASALSVSTASMTRGGERLDARAGDWQLVDRALVSQRAPAIRERVELSDAGPEQSWTFDVRPNGNGDLAIALSVSGESIASESSDGVHLRDPVSGSGIRYGVGTWIDAHGVRTTIVPHAQDGGITLVVPGELLEASSFPAVLDPTLTPEVAMSDPLVGFGPALGEQSYPALAEGAGSTLAVWNDRNVGVRAARLSAGVILDPNGITVSSSATDLFATSATAAFDGTDWLVVWTDGRNSGTANDIYGARIDQSGALLDTTGFAISTDAAWEGAPKVAFGGKNFLVVWHTATDVLATRVSSAGAVLDAPPIRVPIDHAYPSVGFNGTDYLVAVVALAGNEIQAVRVSPDDGSILDSTPIRIGTANYPGGPPGIASNGSDFVLTWSGWYGGTSPLSWPVVDRIGADGSVLGPNLQLFGAGMRSNAFGAGGVIAFDGTNYLVVLGCHGTRIAPDGTVLDNVPVSVCADNSSDGGGNPSVVSDDNGFLFAWQSDDYYARAAYDVRGRHIADSGSLGAPFVITTGPSLEVDPDAASDGQDFFVAWSDTRGEETDIYGARVTPALAVLDPDGIPICTAVGAQEAPATAFDGKNYLVAWEDFRAPTFTDPTFGYTYPQPAIYATWVTPSGTVLREEPISTSTSLPTSGPRVSTGGGSTLVAWLSGYQVFGARVAADGTLLDPAPISIVYSSNANGGKLRVAYGAGVHLVVVAPNPNYSIGDVIGVRVAADGTVLDTTPISIAATSAAESLPSVTFDGTNFVVAFRDDGVNAAEADILVARVTPGGAVLDTPGVIVSKALGKQTAPAVVFDGAHTVIAWQDYRDDPMGDIMAARLDSNGKLVDDVVQGMPIATGYEAQFAPTLASDGSGHVLVAYSAGAQAAFAAYENQLGSQARVRAVVMDDLPRGKPCSSNAQCVDGFCVDGVCCNSACGGPCDVCATSLGATSDGTCTLVAASQQTECGGTYLCDGSRAVCPSRCTSDAACAPSAYCDWSGLCVPRKVAASSCNTAAGQDCLIAGCRACQSGFCVDGFCCDSACDSPCNVCSAALGSSADGTCAIAPPGYPSPGCAPLECDGQSAQCPGACAGDADCQSGYYCDAGSCAPAQVVSKDCTSDTQCKSGHCVDGVCCNTECAGSCVSCNADADHRGACTPIDGPVRGSRPACPAGDGTNPCSAQTCAAGRCAFVGQDVSCRAAICENDQVVPAASCDGSGTCPRITRTCVPFACSDGACKQGSCASDDDCAQGYRCESGACVQGATCDGDHSITLSDGGTSDCAPYRCSKDGTCRTTCTSGADCVAGYACTSAGLCEAAEPPPPSKASGCTCRISHGLPHESSRGFGVALVFASMLLARRRRKVASATRTLLPLLGALVGCAPTRADRLDLATPSSDPPDAQANTPLPDSARPAFQQLDDAFRVEGAGFAALVVDGGFSFEPMRAGRTALRLETRSVARGTHPIGGGAQPAHLDPWGGLALERDGFVERFDARSDGIEQSWTFSERPAGSGDLVVRVGATGMRFASAGKDGIEFIDGLGARVLYGIATWIDARGMKTRVAEGYENGSILITLPSALIDGSSYPSRLDPVVSSEISFDSPLVGSAPSYGADVRPAIASNGTDYLVAWQDGRGGITAARVAADGTVVDTNGIAITASGQRVAVAYNGTDYFVVWQDWRDTATNASDVYGTRVTSNGVVLEPKGIPIATTTSPEEYPDVTSNGSDFLVVWDDSYTVYGRTVRPDASLGTPFIIDQQRACEPVVAYNGSQYRVLARDCFDETKYSNPNFVDQSTFTLGTQPVRTVLEASNNWPSSLEFRAPAIVSNGTDFYQAWQVGFYNPSVHGGINVYGADAPAVGFDGTNWVSAYRLFSGAPLVAVGTAQAIPLPATAAGGQDPQDFSWSPPAMASNGSATLVVWEDSRNATAAPDIYGARVDKAGALLDGQAFLISRRMNGEEDPHAAFNGSNYFVVWSDTRGADPSDVYGVRVSPTGTVLDSTAIAVSTAPGAQGKAAIGSDGQDFFVAWSQGGARVSGDGTVLDPSGIVLPTQGRGVAFGANTYFVVGGGVSVRVARDGTVLDPSGIAVAGNAVAFDGTNFLVVGDTQSVRVAPDGSIVDASGIAVGGEAVAFDGTNYLVVRSYNQDIYAQRVAPDATLVDAAPGIRISTQLRNQGSPRVVFDGGDFVVTWLDYSTDPAGDVYGARLTTAGVLKDSVIYGLPLVTGSEGSLELAMATDGRGRSLLTFVEVDPSSPVYGTYRARGRLITDLPLGEACAGAQDCSSGFCADGVCCTTACDSPCDVCSAALGASKDGQCGTASSQVTCGTTYACDGVSVSCPSACTADSGCAPGAFCSSSGYCVFRKKQGKSCDDRAGKDCLTDECRVCETGFCADGVCCDTACDNSCDACAAKLGAPSDGTCGPAPLGSPGAPACSPAECDGVSTICPGTCSSDLDCDADAHCDTAQHDCQPDEPNGSPCASAGDCISGSCADGFCCDRGCFGQCEACDVTGYEGTCSPVTGVPHGARAPCFAGDDLDPCTAEACNGAQCEPVKDVPCHDASCTDDVQTLAARCDGSGHCPLVTASCLPFACDGAACKSKPCSADADCAAGYRCVNAECVEGARCDGDHTLTLPDGQHQDCAPYRCTSAGTCTEKCESGVDCAAGYACAPDQTCISAIPTSKPSDSGSCQCALKNRTTDRSLWLSFLAIGLLGGRTVGKKRRTSSCSLKRPSH